MGTWKNTWYGHIVQMLFLGILSVALGVLFLTLVFCLPTEPVKRHVSVSVDRMITDPSEEPGQGLQRYIVERKETFTDAIMVQNAFEDIPNRNPYEHAMWAYHLDLAENVWTPEATLKYLSQGGETSGMYLHQYSRYWHGYLVFLKPLLLVFNWEQVLWIGAALQLILMLAVLILACRVKRPEVGIAMIVGLLFMKPLLMLVSLAMNTCWLITLAVMLVILLRHDWLEKGEHYPELFLMTGILVAYFDFLTYPVVTLGFPLCVFFLMKRDSKPDHRLHAVEIHGRAFFMTKRGGGLWENVVQMITYSACWALGYVSMWASKWVLADLTLQAGTIKSAFSSILGWTEAVGGRSRFSGGFYVIGLNLQEYDSWIYPLLLALLILFDISAFVLACRKASLGRAFCCCIPYLLTACIPFAWYIAVQHHSGLHIAFTFRIISVAGLALASAGLGLLRLGKKDTAETGN